MGLEFVGFGPLLFVSRLLQTEEKVRSRGSGGLYRKFAMAFAVDGQELLRSGSTLTLIAPLRLPSHAGV